MRRPLSILIVALFAMGPLSVLLPGSTELQLPACCRRHGTHHCAMSAAMAAPPPGSFWLIAPNRCPLYNAGHLAPVPTFALSHPPAAPGFAATLLVPAHASSATLTRSTIPSSRGPPQAC